MTKINLTINKLRKLNKITQKQLADYLGVSFQSVSKWENGVTMPDITVLPLLAEYFDVTVDQILGLQPLCSEEYISRKTDKAEHWNKKLQYLKHTRAEMWNDDYLEFLVNRVWQITNPIKVIDFGCGYGFLAEKLMPLLPKGSCYTGIDFSKNLIKEAKKIFKNNQYNTEFLLSDFNDYVLKGNYDLAICQAVLRHLPNAKEVLLKMVSSVTKGGRVVTIEINRKLEEMGLYFHNKNYNNNRKLNIEQKMWNYEQKNGYRDYVIGCKVPFYMQELGLKNIDVRVNDKVTLVNTQNKDSLKSFLEANGWHEPKSREEKDNHVNLLMSRGLSRAEVDDYIRYYEDTYEYFNNTDTVQMIRAMCLLISSGIKP